MFDFLNRLTCSTPFHLFSLLCVTVACLVGTLIMVEILDLTHRWQKVREWWRLTSREEKPFKAKGQCYYCRGPTHSRYMISTINRSRTKPHPPDKWYNRERSVCDDCAEQFCLSAVTNCD